MFRRLKFASLISLGLAALVIIAIQFRPTAPHSALAGLSSPHLESISPTQVRASLTLEQPESVLREVRAAVLPHHLVADRLIGRLVSRLDPAPVRTIVLIGPDHANRGPSRFTVSNADWLWNGRTIRVNRDIVSNLKRLPELAVAEPIIQAEHSVLVPLPWLIERFPKTSFVLIAVQGGFDRPAAEQLATALAASLKPDDLVIASVDFSHQSGLSEVATEDERSNAALQAGTVEALASVAADSPMSLAVAAAYAQRRQSKKVTVLEHSNSVIELNGSSPGGITSYFTAVWQSAG